MYGHGAPPTPSTGSVITQRVLYAASGVLCCGMLASVPLFRIAVRRGRVFDWIAAWASIPLIIACVVLIGSVPEEDWRSDAGLGVLLLLGACASAHYLIVDIRLPRRPGPYGGPVPPSPHATTVHAPYGYPQPASPYASTAVPQPPHTPLAAPVPPAPVPPAPVPPAPVPSQAQPPQRPAPARIDQVRAELDELSDYLRRQDGQQRRPGDHEGGR
ncbi:hypothetical protein [Streptomyces sp. MA15]|uniref:hypothetical protein n=1 Tax=Streptomyces sp. MA15 TaxID=3055061 RepID=UPI0025B0CE71|nr:hypothetical protein [Streptomyces sp. MA15]MDN3266050.1 hypothetical protein [Streptomyces sp. MA15]